MNRTLELLEALGKNSSIKQFENMQDMMLQENMTEDDMNSIIDANIPLMCIWVPPKEEEKRKQEDKEDKENGEKDGKKDNEKDKKDDQKPNIH
jgi:hypothetical protein